MSVAKFGGLPYISSPIRNTLPANQMATNTDATPIPIDVHTCQYGGGEFDDIRSSIVNVLTGGMKLIATLNAEFGSREIGSQKIHGNMTMSMIGIIIDCASRMSLTAAPTVTSIAPVTRYEITKKITRYRSSHGLSRPTIANDTSITRPVPT